jgi:hypothetical protein
MVEVGQVPLEISDNNHKVKKQQTKKMTQSNGDMQQIYVLGQLLMEQIHKLL